MRQVRIIAVLLLAILLVVFSVQNANPVQVHFFTWQVETSGALLMLLCVGIGVIATLIALLPALYKKKTSARTEESMPETTEEIS